MLHFRQWAFNAPVVIVLNYSQLIWRTTNLGKIVIIWDETIF